jgi:hypothetical protein
VTSAKLATSGAGTQSAGKENDAPGEDDGGECQPADRLAQAAAERGCEEGEADRRGKAIRNLIRFEIMKRRADQRAGGDDGAGEANEIGQHDGDRVVSSSRRATVDSSRSRLAMQITRRLLSRAHACLIICGERLTFRK